MLTWPVPVAPRPEQDRIIELAASAIAAVDAGVTTRGESLAAISSLERSILAKAFRGELLSGERRR